MAEKGGGQDDQLEELEQQFGEVLAGLTGDVALEAFRAQYEQLYGALRRSHDNEKKLAKKLRETNAEIVQNASRVQQALKLSEEDAATIEELKRQIERAWGMVEQANSREEQAASAIERLQAEIGQLSAVVQRHTNLLGGDMTIEELIHARDSLTIQLREATASASYEKERAQTLAVDLDARNEKFREKKAQVKELERSLAQKTAEETKETKKRVTVEAEVKRLKESIGAQSNKIEEDAKLLAEADESKARLQRLLDQSRAANLAVTSDMHALQGVRLKLEGENGLQRDKIAQLHELRAKLEVDLKATKLSLQSEKSLVAKAQSRLELEEKAKAEVEKELALTQDLAASLRAEKVASDKELSREVLRTKEAESAGAKLGREKTQAEKRAAQEATRVKDAREAAVTLKGGAVLLESEVRKLHVEAHKQESVMSALDRERERALQEVEQLGKRVEELEEEMRLKDVQINELDKREVELNGKIKAATTTFEAMRGERNGVAKQLGETQDEISELKRKSKVQGNQIEQLKEDIHNKDKGLVAEQFESAILAKRLEVRNHEVDQLRRLLDDASDNVARSEGEIAELNKALRRMDSEALAQKRSYDQIVCERDINQAQLMRRNDEISLLYERIAVMTTMLSTGEQAYRTRTEDLKMMKLKLADVSRSLSVAKDETKAGNRDAMRVESVRLQRELLEEQSRVKALSEELSNPANVHRWRKLEGTDPQTFDLVQKTQTLQRRLIAKTEAVVERDMQLADRDREIAELRAQLNNVPGPEVTEQLAAVRLALNDRTRELKAVAAEVNMAQAQVGEFKFDADRLQRELHESKARLYDSKRAASAVAASRVGAGSGGDSGGTGGGGRGAGSESFAVSQRERQRALLAGTSKPVFMGGGFNVHGTS